MYDIFVYEWDDEKRKTNFAKHCFDFSQAHLVYENPNKLTFSAPHPGENRQLDIAFVEAVGKVLTLICVARGTTVRVISFRMASRKERRVYEASKPN